MQEVALKSHTESMLDCTDLVAMFVVAVRNRDSAAVMELVPHLRDVDVWTREGYTSLSLACEMGYTEIARMLLDKNASVTALSAMVRTPRPSPSC